MSPESTSNSPTFEVLDALDHPHGGRILRLRVKGGAAPPLKLLRDAEIRAISPEGVERRARILSFPLTGGIAPEASLRRTGRVDVLVEEEGEGESISLDWRLRTVSD